LGSPILKKFGELFKNRALTWSRENVVGEKKNNTEKTTKRVKEIGKW